MTTWRWGTSFNDLRMSNPSGPFGFYSTSDKLSKWEAFTALPRRKNLILVQPEQSQQHAPGMEWSDLNRAQEKFTGDGLTNCSSTGEKLTELKLTRTDICWHFVIYSRTLFLQRSFSEPLIPKSQLPLLALQTRFPNFLRPFPRVLDTVSNLTEEEPSPPLPS